MAKERQAPLDVGDAGQVADRKLELESHERDEAESFNTVLKSYQGREFVWNLLSQCNLFDEAPMGSQESARFEGRRDIGLWALNKCFTSNPDVYNLMQQEAHKRELRAEDMTNGG